MYSNVEERQIKVANAVTTSFPDDTKSMEEWIEKTKIGSGMYSEWCSELKVSSLHNHEELNN